MNMIQMQSINMSYDQTRVLENLSLIVAAGERTVILGDSGCGKTTILRLISGFIAPDSGNIMLNGVLVAGDGVILVPPEQRHLGMVFQDLALWPHMSVMGNLEFGLKASGVPTIERVKRIKQMLELVGLADLASRKPAQLSGGQQQRVALARALVAKPKILLMDEPLTSMDRDLKVRLRKEIVRLQDTLGFTLLLVTHDRDEALEIGTRVIIVDRGEVTFEGSPDEAARYWA